MALSKDGPTNFVRQRLLLNGEQVFALATNKDSVNGWAISGIPDLDRIHLVVMTKGLLNALNQWRLSESQNVQSWLTAPAYENVFKELWNGLSASKENVDNFAAIIIHVAFAHFIHHEMAHISLGHLRCPSFERTTGFQSEMAVDELVMLDATSTSARVEEAAIHSQCLELDADIHALHWTTGYLTKLSAEDHSSWASTFQPMWSSFNDNVIGRRYLVVLAAFILYGVLGSRSFKLEELSSNTHPPAIVRMMLLLHVENRISQVNGATGSLQIDALLHGITLFAQKTLHISLARPEYQEVTHDVSGMNGQQLFERMLGELGIRDSLNKWDEIGDHIEKLAVKRKALDPCLVKSRLLREDIEILNWYS